MHVYGSGPDQVVEMFGTTGPVIAVVHGGFWRPEYDSEHTRPLAHALARALDARVANIEYRRIPGDPDASVEDVTAALALLHAMEQTPALLVGHSAGGHLALCALARSPRTSRGVVALAPVSDLALAHDLDLDDGATADFLGCAAAERPDLDPQRFLPGVDDGPTSRRSITVIHGTDDIRVPIDMSRGFRAGSLIELSGVGHFELIDPQSAAFDAVVAEVRRGLVTAEA